MDVRKKRDGLIMKYNIGFKISFIMYTLALVALPYMTARTWADIIALLFVVAVFYELFYLFYLRKKDNVKLSRAIAQYFLYLLISLELYVLINCIDLAVNGYTPTDFLGNSIGEAVYGLKAIIEDKMGVFVFGHIIVIATIYQIIYAIATKRSRR